VNSYTNEAAGEMVVVVVSMGVVYRIRPRLSRGQAQIFIFKFRAFSGLTHNKPGGTIVSGLLKYFIKS